MARLGAAVNIVTTDGPAGRHGMTMSAVCAVSDAPPTLLACVNRGARANAMIRANRVLCVNVLGAGHEALSGRFARRDMEDRFGEGEWGALVTGAPTLADAAAALDCRVASISEVGSHSVFFCEVAAIATGAAHDGLIYFNRGYHPLPIG